MKIDCKMSSVLHPSLYSFHLQWELYSSFIQGVEIVFPVLESGRCDLFWSRECNKDGMPVLDWTATNLVVRPQCSTRPLKLPYEYARATLWGMSDAVEESTVVPAKALSGQPTAGQPENMRERRAHQRSAELPPQPIADSRCPGKPSLDHRVTAACLKC